MRPSRAAAWARAAAARDQLGAAQAHALASDAAVDCPGRSAYGVLNCLPLPLLVPYGLVAVIRKW